MKKTILLSALLLTMVGVQAQDTLVSVYPKSNCYYSYWLDSGEVTDWGYMMQGRHNLLSAVYFETDEPLPIYGIAGALMLSYEYVRDSSEDSSFEYWGIYKHEADTLRLLGDSLYVHPVTTPTAYYIHNPNPAYPWSTALDDYFAVYECYYKHPIYVTDSFYVATTSQSWREVAIVSGPDSGEVYNIHPQVLIGSYFQSGSPSPYKFLYKDRQYWDGTITYHYWGNQPYQASHYYYPYFFPIFTPPYTDTTGSDTTHIDTTHVDTVGIGMRLLERYTGLQPNPAAERVLVTSSFGLQQIELYNAAGIKVYEQQATGYSATLDVHTLPAGPYLARITTPRGTVTKKLVVQRR